MLPKITQITAIQKIISKHTLSFWMKALPLLLVLVSILMVHFLHLEDYGIKTFGEIPSEFSTFKYAILELGTCY